MRRMRGRLKKGRRGRVAIGDKRGSSGLRIEVRVGRCNQ